MKIMSKKLIIGVVVVVVLVLVAYYFYSNTSAPVATTDENVVEVDEISVEDQQLDELGLDINADQMEGDETDQALDEVAN